VARTLPSRSAEHAELKKKTSVQIFTLVLNLTPNLTLNLTLTLTLSVSLSLNIPLRKDKLNEPNEPNETRQGK
jgi:hypothetical protein